MWGCSGFGVVVAEVGVQRVPGTASAVGDAQQGHCGFPGCGGGGREEEEEDAVWEG